MSGDRENNYPMPDDESDPPARIFDESAGDEGSPDADQPVVLRPLSGVDLARAALAKAKEEARARGKAGPPRRTRASAAGAPRRRDPGDPEPLGETLGRLLAERGWDVPAAAAGVTERWAEIAGNELAAHCKPEKFDSGVLVLVAESTAWASQVRLLVPQLHRRIDEVIGRGVVSRVEVHGPMGPDWRRGPLRVRGLGPRDTYG
jgi:predicted nucleic acid-binding Zn ribbon protein